MGKSIWTTEAGAAQALAAALRLHQAHGQALASHPRVPALLAAYQRAIHNTALFCQECGLPAMCCACAASHQICCFKGVEDRYDAHLLLINALLGVDLTQTHESEVACCFCGATGCVLMAKSSFCLNFMCADMKQRLGPVRLRRVLAVVGFELQSQWELERVLAPWLWAAGARAKQRLKPA